MRADTIAFRVRLSARQNPDLPRRNDLPKALTVGVATLEEASETCCRLIREHDLGGGNWSGGQVRDVATGKLVARVSYNGRVWTQEGSDCKATPGPSNGRLGSSERVTSE